MATSTCTELRDDCPLCKEVDPRYRQGEWFFTHLTQAHMEFRNGNFFCPCGFSGSWLKEWQQHYLRYGGDDGFALHYHESLHGGATVRCPQGLQN
jgi:hypothetical protein